MSGFSSSFSSSSSLSPLSFATFFSSSQNPTSSFSFSLNPSPNPTSSFSFSPNPSPNPTSSSPAPSLFGTTTPPSSAAPSFGFSSFNPPASFGFGSSATTSPSSAAPSFGSSNPPASASAPASFGFGSSAAFSAPKTDVVEDPKTDAPVLEMELGVVDPNTGTSTSTPTPVSTPSTTAFGSSITPNLFGSSSPTPLSTTSTTTLFGSTTSGPVSTPAVNLFWSSVADNSASTSPNLFGSASTGEDLLNGRGSEALGDFGRGMTESAMAEETGHGEIGTRVHSGEVQSAEVQVEQMQEDAPPLIQTDIRMQPEGMKITVEEAARNAKKQTVEEERVPTPHEVIRNFPAGHVDEVCFPLLNSIALVHPETFTNFRCCSLAAAGSFLTMLHDSVRDWNQTSVRAFTPAMEQELQALSLDLAQVGFDLGWMTQRGAEVLAAGQRRKVQERIRALTDRLESAQKQVADIEGELAEAQLEDLELAAGAPHEFKLFNPDESVFGGL